MKKILAFLLAGMMVLSFTACKKNETPVEPSNPGVDASNPSTSTSTPQQNFSSDYARGTWENDVYKNELMQFTFALPEGFVVATDEELMEMINLGQEYLTDDMKQNYDLAVSNATSFYDFAITNPVSRSSFMFMLENLSKTLGGNAITETMYLDILEQQLVTVETLGYKIVGRAEELIAGETYQVLEVTAMEGVLTQKYYVKKVGNYMVAFIGTYAQAEKEAYNAVVSSLTKI